MMQGSLPDRLYAICFPSGDHVGPATTVSPVPDVYVRRCMSLPSALISQISYWPLRSDMNAMRRLSGDQRGNRSTKESSVSWRRPVPSVRITKISSGERDFKGMVTVEMDDARLAVALSS